MTVGHNVRYGIERAPPRRISNAERTRRTPHHTPDRLGRKNRAPTQRLRLIIGLILMLAFARLEALGYFQLVVKSRYPVDISRKSSSFPVSFWIRLPQDVIKMKASQFKLPRIPARSCRNVLKNSVRNDSLAIILRRLQDVFRNHRSAYYGGVRFAPLLQPLRSRRGKINQSREALAWIIPTLG